VALLFVVPCRRLPRDRARYCFAARAEVSAGSDGLAGECRADRQGAAAL